MRVRVVYLQTDRATNLFSVAIKRRLMLKNCKMRNEIVNGRIDSEHVNENFQNNFRNIQMSVRRALSGK